MFGWFTKKQTEPVPERKPIPESTVPESRLNPESQWIVECDDQSIRVTDAWGVCRTLPKTDLSGVIIETNDTGPWGSDIWWLLFGADDKVAVLYPQGATGEAAVLDYLHTLPGIDYEAMIAAMKSIDNNVFPVWRLKR